MDIPNSILEINKKYKTQKISTLSKAKSLYLKRYFSGAFNIDALLGGGFAYKRIIMLYGSKSSGKNALLNQTTAFAQRCCRNCHAILPEFYEVEDRWSFILKHILGLPVCTCGAPTNKIVLFVDYEDNLSMEDPKTIKITKITNDLGAEIDELDYNDKIALVSELKSKDSLSDEESKFIKETEKWAKKLKFDEQEIIHMATQDYLTACGVLTDKVMVAVPEDTEEGVELIMPIIKSKDVDLIVWDSLQGAIPRYVKDREPGQADMGAEAKANGKLMRYVVSSYAPQNIEDEYEAYKPTLFITSQVRASLGGFHSGPDSYSGGNAVAHHSSAIIELKRETFLKEDGTDASNFKETFFGQRIRVRTDKNKLFAPGDIYNYDYYFRAGEHHEIGIDHVKEIVELGVKTSLIERAGAFYKTKGQTFRGMNELVSFFRENGDFVGELYKDIKTKL